MRLAPHPDPFLGALALAGATVVLFGWFAGGVDARELEARERAWGATIRAGDLVFQDLDCGERCELIRRVTHSRYSHVGIVVGAGDARVVWEAMGPVGPRPLAAFVAHGRERRVAVYRPRAPLRRVRRAVEARVFALHGRPYDGDYQWDDARIYCSELVAKAYRDALGHDLVAPHPVDLGDLAPRVAELSGGRLTSATPMVTPADLVGSGRFVRIVDELR